MVRLWALWPPPGFCDGAGLGPLAAPDAALSRGLRVIRAQRILQVAWGAGPLAALDAAFRGLRVVPGASDFAAGAGLVSLAALDAAFRVGCGRFGRIGFCSWRGAGSFGRAGRCVPRGLRAIRAHRIVAGGAVAVVWPRRTLRGVGSPAGWPHRIVATAWAVSSCHWLPLLLNRRHRNCRRNRRR